eukprot:403363473
MKSSKTQLDSAEELEYLIEKLKNDLNIKTPVGYEYGERSVRNDHHNKMNMTMNAGMGGGRHRKTSSFSYKNDIDFDSPDSTGFNKTNIKLNNHQIHQSFVMNPSQTFTATDLNQSYDAFAMSHKYQMQNSYKQKKSSFILKESQDFQEQEQQHHNEVYAEDLIDNNLSSNQQQLTQLFTIAESLLRDYKKASYKLQKSKQRNKLQESTIQELEFEIRSLRQNQEEEQQIINQFEQDYSHLKIEHQQLIEDLRLLNDENIFLKSSLSHNSQQKDELKSDLGYQLQNLKDQLQHQTQDNLELKQCQLNSDHEYNLLLRKFESLERANEELREGYLKKESITQISTSNTPNNLKYQLDQLEEDNAFRDIDDQAEEDIQIHKKPSKYKFDLKLDAIQYDKEKVLNQPSSARQELSNQKDKTLANELNVEVFDDVFSNDDANNQFIFNDPNEQSPRYTPHKNDVILFDRNDPNCQSLYGGTVKSKLVARNIKQAQSPLLTQYNSLTNKLRDNSQLINNSTIDGVNNMNQSLMIDEQELQQEFKQYLGRVYADMAFEKYQQILKNEKKLSINDLKKRRPQSSLDVHTHNSLTNLAPNNNTIQYKDHLKSNAKEIQAEEKDWYDNDSSQMNDESFSFTKYLQDHNLKAQEDNQLLQKQPSNFRSRTPISSGNGKSNFTTQKQGDKYDYNGNISNNEQRSDSNCSIF